MQQPAQLHCLPTLGRTRLALPPDTEGGRKGAAGDAFMVGVDMLGRLARPMGLGGADAGPCEQRSQGSNASVSQDRTCNQ